MIQRGRYRHYKGRFYEVLGTVRHSETEELMVLYKPLYKAEEGSAELWVRPLTMFQESVVIEGVATPRFAYEGSAGTSAE